MQRFFFQRTTAVCLTVRKAQAANERERVNARRSSLSVVSFTAFASPSRDVLSVDACCMVTTVTSTARLLRRVLFKFKSTNKRGKQEETRLSSRPDSTKGDTPLCDTSGAKGEKQPPHATGSVHIELCLVQSLPDAIITTRHSFQA